MLLPETLRLHDHQKFRFHIIYFLPWKDQMVEALKQAGGEVTCMPATNNLQMLFKTGDIIRYCRQHQIRLIHCHLPWAGIVGRLVFKFIRGRVPVIYTEHNKYERYHLFTRLFNRLTFNWQSTAVAVSEDVMDSIMRNIRPSIPVRKILNGVDTDFFHPDKEAGQKLRAQLGIPEDAIVIGTMAVFRFQKRLKEWLDIFKKALECNHRLYGIIAGDGPLRKELEVHRKSLSLEHRVIMPGLQSQVKPWYSAMDIFMMTSVFEGLPVALLEAMSMQCAVITTDAGGIKEVVRNAIDGIVVPTECLDVLAEKIEHLARDERSRRQLGEAARNRVKENFSLTRMVGELEVAYVELLKNQ